MATQQDLIDQLIAHVWGGDGPLGDMTEHYETWFDAFSTVDTSPDGDGDGDGDEVAQSKQQRVQIAALMRMAADKLEAMS
jgi:hypothetical protein